LYSQLIKFQLLIITALYWSKSSSSPRSRSNPFFNRSSSSNRSICIWVSTETRVLRKTLWAVTKERKFPVNTDLISICKYILCGLG
jgi:hypothetical protein